MTRRRFSILAQLSWNLLRLRLSPVSNSHESKQLLFDSFKHLGVYIKFLQILALNVDFLKGWGGTEEFEIFEAAPLEPLNLRALLRHEIPDYEHQFRMIVAEPFAAGSFAQVYHAELTDGTAVVLKVLRPSLVQNLSSDLRLLGFISRLSSVLHSNSLVDMRQLYRQFAHTVRGETDYRHEVQNAQWFYEYFKGHRDIVIPKTFAGLSTEHIIVQEFVAGISLADVLAARQRGTAPAALIQDELGSNLWVQLETLGVEILSATLLADLVLGDPHPGNIKLLPGNKIGLIDFGIAAPAPANRQAFLDLTREYQKLYAEQFDPSSFTIAALNFFDEDLVQALVVTGKMINPQQPNLLLNAVGQAASQTFATSWSSQKTQNFLRLRKMMHLFNQSINDHNRLGVQMSLESAMMLKAGTTYLSMVASLGDNNEKNLVIKRAIDRTIAAAELQPLAQEATRPTLNTAQALELLGSWLSRVADTDPFLYQQITATIAA